MSHFEDPVSHEAIMRMLVYQQITLAAKRTGGLRMSWNDVLLLDIDVKRAQLAENNPMGGQHCY